MGDLYFLNIKYPQNYMSPCYFSDQQNFSVLTLLSFEAACTVTHTQLSLDYCTVYFELERMNKNF